MTGVVFPSDALSIKKLRSLFPEKFGATAPNEAFNPPKFFSNDEPGNANEVLGSGLLRLERSIVFGGFLETSGVGIHDLLSYEKEMREKSEALADSYLLFDIAEDRVSALMMARQLRQVGRELGGSKHPTR